MYVMKFMDGIVVTHRDKIIATPDLPKDVRCGVDFCGEMPRALPNFKSTTSPYPHTPI